MEKLIAALENMGLNDREARTYLTLLDIGKGSILDVAKRTHISRATLYGVMDSLIEQGIITQSIEGKRTVYYAKHPDTVYALFQERMGTFKHLLPEFASLLNVSTNKPTMEYLDGLDGIKQAFLDAARSDRKRIQAFVGLDHLLARSRALEHFWYGEFRDMKEKNGIQSQLILPDTPEGRAFKERDEENYRTSQFVPASTYNFPAEMLIYDDSVVFFSYNEKEEFAMKVRSEAIAETVRMIFKMAWNLSY